MSGIKGVSVDELTADAVQLDNTDVEYRSTEVQSALKEVRDSTIFSIQALTTTLNGNHDLAILGDTISVVNGSSTGYSVTLPDATELFTGRRFEIDNKSSETITIKNKSGTIETRLIPGDTGTFTLETNALLSGTWLATIVTSAATGITSYTIESDTLFNTTSLTDAVITGFTITPVSGRYAAFFAADINIHGNNALSDCVMFVGGSAVENTRRTAQGVSSNFITSFNTLGEINVDGSQAVDVRVNVSANDLDVSSRSLFLIRLGS